MSTVGDRFERQLNLVHAQYRAMGVAEIRQLPVPTAAAPRKWQQRGAPPLRMRSERSPYDFAGHMRASPFRGISVAMESKIDHAAGDASPSLKIHGENKTGSGLQFHQLRALAEAHQDGCIAAVVWASGINARILCIPGVVLAGAWAEFRSEGRKSIPAAMGVDVSSPVVGQPRVAIPWLEAAIDYRTGGVG